MNTCTFVVVGLLALSPAAVAAPEAPEPAVETANVTHPELREQLLDLRERDQAARKALIDVAQQAQEENPGGGFQLGPEHLPLIIAIQQIDAESTAFLKETVEEHGWPTISMVGGDGADAAWLLVQHADKDPEFQGEVLDLMEPLVAEGEASPKNFAYLTDRVRLARGEKQVYATQFAADEKGVQRPRPTIDHETIEERRAEVGLPPLAEYCRALSESYGGKASPEPLESFETPGG